MREVLARVVAIPGPLPFVQAVRAIRSRDDRTATGVEHAPYLAEQRLRVIEVGDHLEREDEAEGIVGRRNVRAVVLVEQRAVPGTCVRDDLGVDLDAAILGARLRKDLRSVALAEADVEDAGAAIDEPGGGLVCIEVQGRDGQLVGRGRLVGDEPDRGRLQGAHPDRTQCCRLTRRPKS